MPRKTSQLSLLGMRIDTIRVQKGCGLGHLAVDARLNYSQIYRIMHGGSNPSRDSLLRICRALRCTPEESARIFAETDYRAPTSEELLEEESPQDIIVAS
jgi:transcriptional regulator with XRE-family HTH domain